MADRLHDTDPQSPLARLSRTDPGLGDSPPTDSAGTEHSPRPPAAPTPSPGSASIEELLDGITGPRPPPSRREATPQDAGRAYASARHAPASQPMPLREPAVISSSPPPAHPGETTQPRKRPEPDSTRPLVRGIAEERTVYTGRRAMIRNIAVVLASAAVVTLMMTSILRWNDAHRPPRAAASVVPPPALETETPPPPVALPAATPAPPVVVAPVVTAPKAAVGGAKPASPKRGKGEAKAPPPSQDSLDDLNRQIRH